MTDWAENADYARGIDLLQLQRWAAAEPLLRAAADAQPDRPRIHANLARALDHQGRLDEALEAAEASTRLGPDDDYAWWALALVRISRNEHAAGHAAALHAVEVAPNDAMRARGLAEAARASVLQKDHRQGLRHANEALHLDPSDDGYWYLRAVALAELGRWGEAARDIRQALGRDALNTDYQEALRSIDESVATLRQILPDARRRAASEDTSAAWQELAELLVRLGELDEALTVFDEARRRHADAPLDGTQMLSPWEADARLALLGF